ncbi:MerR family transcriptional regulator [Sporichthya polymorpha]|uniref:MerR family transcriptional regulator n=1 Tax=Sporichthya polymorpha TaxID=35751 RepID=UPI0003694AE2|nr:MerR family transcriptional regulator [Sporichthya polymorpha]
MNGYTVGEVAKLAHISVRTLHHYDELGLLTPAGRSPAGYRLYSTGDLRRLQQILFYRELEFSLEEIASMLADPDVDVDDHLRRQHRLVRERQARNAALLAAIEKEMEARSMGMALTPEEQFEIFGTDKIAEYQEEAKEKWGDTDAWRESQRRSARYTKEDWIEIKEQAGANIEGFLAAIRAGEPADGPVAMQLAEEHRQHLIRWFYDCGGDMHRGLGDLYISDPRYLAEYDKLAPGFSQYVRDAFHANADRL